MSLFLLVSCFYLINPTKLHLIAVSWEVLNNDYYSYERYTSIYNFLDHIFKTNILIFVINGHFNLKHKNVKLVSM